VNSWILTEGLKTFSATHRTGCESRDPSHVKKTVVVISDSSWSTSWTRRQRGREETATGAVWAVPSPGTVAAAPAIEVRVWGYLEAMVVTTCGDKSSYRRCLRGSGRPAAGGRSAASAGSGRGWWVGLEGRCCQRVEVKEEEEEGEGERRWRRRRRWEL
jgi:hypothetical protein